MDRAFSEAGEDGSGSEGALRVETEANERYGGAHGRKVRRLSRWTPRHVAVNGSDSPLRLDVRAIVGRGTYKAWLKLPTVSPKHLGAPSQPT